MATHTGPNHRPTIHMHMHIHIHYEGNHPSPEVGLELSACCTRIASRSASRDPRYRTVFTPTADRPTPPTCPHTPHTTPHPTHPTPHTPHPTPHIHPSIKHRRMTTDSEDSRPHPRDTTYRGGGGGMGGRGQPLAPKAVHAVLREHGRHHTGPATASTSPNTSPGLRGRERCNEVQVHRGHKKRETHRYQRRRVHGVFG